MSDNEVVSSDHNGTAAHLEILHYKLKLNWNIEIFQYVPYLNWENLDISWTPRIKSKNRQEQLH